MSKAARSTGEKFPITVTYGDKEYVGDVKPVGDEGGQEKYEITFSGAFWGTIRCGGGRQMGGGFGQEPRTDPCHRVLYS